jgi:hypothetical protein
MRRGRLPLAQAVVDERDQVVAQRDAVLVAQIHHVARLVVLQRDVLQQALGDAEVAGLGAVAVK